MHCVVCGGQVQDVCGIFHTELILPLLSNALPMYDEICKRTVNFIKSPCLNSDCVLVNRLTCRGITSNKCGLIYRQKCSNVRVVKDMVYIILISFTILLFDIGTRATFLRN